MELYRSRIVNHLPLLYFHIPVGDSLEKHWGVDCFAANLGILFFNALFARNFESKDKWAKMIGEAEMLLTVVLMCFYILYILGWFWYYICCGWLLFDDHITTGFGDFIFFLIATVGLLVYIVGGIFRIFK